jgi:YidC/Oxa1 family membrane protein insertase
MYLIRLLLFITYMSAPLLVNASPPPVKDLNSKVLVETLINTPNTLISEHVQENSAFYGLASYYNNINYFIVEKDGLRRLDESEAFEINRAQWLAVVGRFNVLLIKANGLSMNLDKSKLIINNPQILIQSDTIVSVVTKAELSSIAIELDQIRYAHLWSPFSWMAKVVELSLVTINTDIVSNWGLAIVIFSVLLKLLLLPVGMMTVSFQRKVSQVQARLAPRLAEIKINYDGEEAHNHLMAAHKELRVTPFYTLKPMLGSFIQIPIMIAVFNALGEMPQLDGQLLLWIDNLAYPDVVGHLPFYIPMFGDTLSILPFVMTVVTLFSTVIFQNRHALKVEVIRQKRNLYLMAIAFFVLFYPFPAVMVLYWTLTNLLQTIQQQIIRI